MARWKRALLAGDEFVKSEGRCGLAALQRRTPKKGRLLACPEFVSAAIMER